MIAWDADTGILLPYGAHPRQICDTGNGTWGICIVFIDAASLGIALYEGYVSLFHYTRKYMQIQQEFAVYLNGALENIVLSCDLLDIGASMLIFLCI